MEISIKVETLNCSQVSDVHCFNSVYSGEIFVEVFYVRIFIVVHDSVNQSSSKLLRAKHQLTSNQVTLKTTGVRKGKE